MKRKRLLTGLSSILLFGTAVFAQAPSSEVDTHIATAKAAAGQDYRGTFVNLCLPGGAPGGAARGAGGGGRGAAPAARGAAATAPTTPDRTS